MACMATAARKNALPEGVQVIIFNNYIYIHIYTYINSLTYVYKYIYIYIYVYIYIYTYINRYNMYTCIFSHRP